MNFFRPLLLSAILCILAVAEVCADSSIPILSLDSVLRRIHATNSMLKAITQRANSKYYEMGSLKRFENPSIGAGTFLTPYPGQTKTFPSANQGYFALQVEQNFTPKRNLKAQKEWMRSLGEVEESDKEITFNELRAQAKMNYYAWHIDARRLRLLREHLLRLQTIRKIEVERTANEGYELGGLYKLDAKISQVMSDITRYETSIDTYRYALSALMETDINNVFSVDTALVLPLTSAENFDSLNLRYYREDIRKTEKQMESLRLQMATLEKNVLPNFNFSFSHLFAVNPQHTPQAFNVLFQVKLPLFSGQSKFYFNQKQSLRTQIKALNLEKNAQFHVIQSRLYSLETRMDMLKNRVRILRQKTIPALRRVYLNNAVLYEDESLPLYALIEDWEAFETAQMDALDSEAQLYEAIVAYEKEIFK